MTLHLGLISDNIARSESPRLLWLAGIQNNLTVTHDLLIPREISEDFDTVFRMAACRGYHGVIVTHPYKDRVQACW